MKVLTVRQPWAWLIAAGHKDIENRTWATSYRGPLLIQASAKRPNPAEWDEAIRFAHARGSKLPHDYAFGGVVAHVVLVDCVRHHSSPWFTGPVGWVLRGQRRTPFVKLSGRLYLFDAAPEIIAQATSPLVVCP